ncbi:MAG TPA: hypothetical protein VF092_23780 [Longimicrobium sp.]
MIDVRRASLERHLDDLRKNDGWRPFQNFVLGLLHHEGYTDVRFSNARSDFGRDAVAVTPDGERCVVAVSFDCSRSKVLHDAKRWTEDPDREAAIVMVFVTADAPTEKTWGPWKREVEEEVGLELRMFHRDTILDVATRDSVWRETCARLGLPGDRPGFRLVTPYDGELVRAALQARPAEWLAKRIELREWQQLSGELRNRLILGKPGAGKTTTLFVHLEATRPEKVLVVEPDLRAEKVEELLDAASGGGVIVFDDAHEKPNELRGLMSALRARLRDIPEVSARYRDVRVLVAARSQEWSDIQPPFSPTELQDLQLTASSRLVLGALSREQCRELVAACVEQRDIEAEPRLLDLAAARAAERDATPLYVLSMLAPAHVEGTLRDAHLAGLPSSVLELWQEYWRRLTSVDQGVLRLVKLFAVTQAPSERNLFDAAARAFSLSPHDVAASLDALQSSLWIALRGELPTCLDVQFEAIALGPGDLRTWDAFISALSADSVSRIQMHIGTGVYYVKFRAARAGTRTKRQDVLLAAERNFIAVTELADKSDTSFRALALNNLSVIYSDLTGLETTREGRAAWLRRAVDAVEEAVRIYSELGVQGDLAMSLNNLSNRYSDLAGLETTREARAAWLRRAVDAVEEAVRIYRELGVQGDLATSLNNLSIHYSDLAGLETTREARDAWLRRAVDAVEEAVRIFRGLGVQGDLASSLNNLSNRYSDLAGLETTCEARAAWLRKAGDAVEEAIRIRRELGVQGDLAMSLNNLSNRYSDLSGLETTREGRAAWLRRAVDAVEEAVRIYRELGVQGDLASSLNNLSNRYSDLAGLETTREARATWLRSAVDAVEEAVRIFRGLGVQGDLATSLNNLSVIYSALAGLETTREARAAWLRRAVDAVEEAVRIRRELGVQGDLAMSLNNLANRYSDLAGLETKREARAAWLRSAVDAVEEAIRIDRELGVQGDLATSLNNLSIHYSDLAGLKTTREARAAWLRSAVDAVEEAVRIRRELGVEGDLASSLNNLSVHYSALEGLETTREARAAWLRSAVDAVEEAVRIRREVGVQGDLATSLNNLSNRYSDLAGLETTREARAAWLRSAVDAVEDAVRIRRELGVEGDLASSLNNLSVHYSDLAGLETTREGRVAWLRKAVDAVEEAIRIRRELGVHGDLAMSLNNLSNRYSGLAGLETTREARAAWLQRAVAAVEEAVRIDRELGVQGDLATSLGATCQVLRRRAENAEDAVESLPDLRASRDAIEEAARLFRENGNTPYFLVSLVDVVISQILLAQTGDPVDLAAIREVCTEGRTLAESMGDNDKLAFFDDVLSKLG